MLRSLGQRSRRVWKWVAAAVALVVLNGSVTFSNLWPTLGVHWPGELSVEITAVLLLLALLNAWKGRTAPRIIALLSTLIVAFALARYGGVTTPALYGREVNLYWDAPRMVSVVEMLSRVATAWQIVALCGGLVLILGLMYRVARWSLRQIDIVLHEHRGARIGVAVCCVLLVGSFIAQQLSDQPVRIPRFSIPVSRTYGNQFAHLLDALSSSRSARLLPPSPPLASSLKGLCGSDVLLVFVESYGSVTYDRPEFERALQPARTRLAQAIQDTGRGVASAFVVSPTFAGQSVLAHLSLLSGIEVRDSNRYSLLMTQKRPTLISAFKQAGYRTVAIMPGMQQDWPEGSFYGFDDIYDATRLDYRGPQFGWWRIPDQYTLAALDTRELQRHPRKPLLIFFPTVSTHIPFRPIPPLQPDWQRILSPQPYDPAPLRDSLAQRVDWTAMGHSYVRSVEYFMDVLTGYLRERANDNLVLILLGDHQPAANVSGEGAPWDVPVHLITRNAELLGNIERLGFRSGLTPERPVAGKMNELSADFLGAFDKGAKCVQPPPSSPQRTAALSGSAAASDAAIQASAH